MPFPYILPCNSHFFFLLLPFSWAHLAVDPELPRGQFKRSPLSFGRRQQHLLTWPYLPRLLEGTGYFDNSTCNSFRFLPEHQSSTASLHFSFLLRTQWSVPSGGDNGENQFQLLLQVRGSDKVKSKNNSVAKAVDKLKAFRKG